MYPQVSITATSSGINIYANFVYVAPPPPPPPSNKLTAPGTVGDGQIWVLLRDNDGSYGWDVYQDYILNPPDPSQVTTIGVYASGAVVTV